MVPLNLEEILDTRNKLLASAPVDQQHAIAAQFEIAMQLCRIADALDLANENIPWAMGECSSNIVETIRKKIL